jgi:hypothetical protein
MAGKLFDNPRVGRRPLLVASNVGIAFSLLLLGANFLAREAAKAKVKGGYGESGGDGDDSGGDGDGDSGDGDDHSSGGGDDSGDDSEATQVSVGLAVTALVLFVSFFSLGMGPGAWLVPSEVFSLNVRAKAMSLATFANRGGRGGSDKES